jgi:hypothetical protein
MLATALSRNLKRTLINTMGQYCLIDSTPSTLGIRDKMPKFSLEMSIVPKANH